MVPEYETNLRNSLFTQTLALCKNLFQVILIKLFLNIRVVGLKDVMNNNESGWFFWNNLGDSLICFSEALNYRCLVCVVLFWQGKRCLNYIKLSVEKENEGMEMKK